MSQLLDLFNDKNFYEIMNHAEKETDVMEYIKKQNTGLSRV